MVTLLHALGATLNTRTVKGGNLMTCFQDMHVPHEALLQRNYLGMKQQEDTSFFSSA